MSRRCQVSGAQPSFGKAVSHSHRRTSRRFDPNVQSKRYRLADGRPVRLTLTAKAVRTLDRRGLDAVAATLRGKGVRI